MDIAVKKYFENFKGVRFDYQLKDHTTYKVGGPADVFINVHSDSDLIDILTILEDRVVPYFFIGNGSNLLISDSGYPGVVLKLGDSYKDIAVDGQMIIAGAGCLLWDLIRMSAEAALSGLEGLSGIPGTLGGALRMNAGAWKSSISDSIETVRVFDLDKMMIREISSEEASFKYRHSNERMIFLQATFALKKGTREEIDRQIKEIIGKRNSTQPVSMASAGCVFKNPENDHAGAIIDRLGLKERTIGGAEVSAIHANFLVNKGNATATDIWILINEVKKIIKDTIDKDLELEVKLKGDFGGRIYL